MGGEPSRVQEPVHPRATPDESRGWLCRVFSAALFTCAVLTLQADSGACAATAADDSLSQSSPHWEWKLAYASKYLFQGGLDYSEGRPVIQPQEALTCGVFSMQA
jgi:hypothetical protein